MDDSIDTVDTLLKDALDLQNQRKINTGLRSDPELDTRFFNAALNYLLASTTDHWWCSAEILPLARESLWLFSLEDLPTILKYKEKLNDLLQQCPQCVQSYYESKNALRKRYLNIYTPEQVDRLFNLMEVFDQSRLNTTPTSSAITTTELTDQQCCAVTELACFPYYLSQYDDLFCQLFETMETTGQKQSLEYSQVNNISLLVFHHSRLVRVWASHLLDKFTDDDPTHTNLNQTLIDDLTVLTRMIFRYFGQPSPNGNFELQIPKYDNNNNNVRTFTLLLTQNSNNIWKGVRHLLDMLPDTALETFITSLDTSSSSTPMFDLLTYQLQKHTPSTLHISGLLKTMSVLWERLQDRFWGKDALIKADIETYCALLRKICDHREYRTWAKTAQVNDDAIVTTVDSDKKLLRNIRDMLDWIFPFWSSLCKTDGVDYVTDKVLDTLLSYFQLPTWKPLFQVYAAIIAFRVIRHSITENTGIPIKSINRLAHVWVPFAMHSSTDDDGGDDKSALVSTRQNARESATSILTDILCQDSRSLRDAYITLAMSSSSSTLDVVFSSTMASDQQGILSSAYPQVLGCLQVQQQQLSSAGASATNRHILPALISAYAPLVTIDTIQQQSTIENTTLESGQSLLLGRMKVLREMVSAALESQNNSTWKERKAMMRDPSLSIPFVSLLTFSSTTIRQMISVFMTKRTKQKDSNSSKSNSTSSPPNNNNNKISVDAPLQFLFDNQPQSTLTAITHILTDFMELSNVQAETYYVAATLGKVLQSTSTFLMDEESGYLSELVKADENYREEQTIMEYWNLLWQVTSTVVMNSYHWSKMTRKPLDNDDDVLDMVVLWIDIATQTIGYYHLFQQLIANDSLDTNTLVSTVDALSFWINTTERPLLEDLVPLLNKLLQLLELVGIKVSLDVYVRLKSAVTDTDASSMLTPDEKRQVSSVLLAHEPVKVIFLDDSDDEYMEWQSLPIGNSSGAMDSSDVMDTSFHTGRAKGKTTTSHQSTTRTRSKITGHINIDNTTANVAPTVIDVDEFFGDDLDDSEPPAKQRKTTPPPASLLGNKRNRTQSNATTSNSVNSSGYLEQNNNALDDTDTSDSDNNSDSGLSGLVDIVNKKQKLNQQTHSQRPGVASRHSATLLDNTAQDRRLGTKPNHLSTTATADVTTTNAQRTLRIKQAENERKMKRNPNIDQLYKTIFSWSLENIKSDTPPHISSLCALRHVQDTYRDYRDYYDLFEPLLLLEVWSQFIRAKDTLSSSNVMDWFTMKSRRYFNDFVDVTFNVPLTVKVNLAVDDLVCMANHFGPDFFFTRMIRGAAMAASELTKGHRWHDKAFLGKVVTTNHGTMSGDIVVRCYFPPERINILNSLAAKSVWKCIKVTSLMTVQREYAALLGLRHYGLAKDILSPHPTPLPFLCEQEVENCAHRYDVNNSQATAIVGALYKPKGFTLIQGPPGTGKTKTILALIDRLLEQQRHQVSRKPGGGKILVCAPSNAAVDEIAKRLKHGISTIDGLIKPNVVRIGVAESVHTSVKDLMLENQVDQLVNPPLSPPLQPNNDGREKSMEGVDDHGNNNSDNSNNSNINRNIDLSTQRLNIRESIRTIHLDLQQVNRDMYNNTNSESDITALRDQQKDLETKLERQLISLKENGRELQEYTIDLKMRRTRARESILRNCDIVCTTLSGSSHSILFEMDMVFDTVIVDEAAQAVEVSTLIPLKYDCKRCVLVGDTNQLPPTVLSQVASKFDYVQSLFMRLEKNAPDNVYMLNIQYRMHPYISVLPSNLFYQSKLLDGPDMAKKTEAVWHQYPLFPPFMFFDVVGGKERQSRNSSLYNSSEADAAVALVDLLASSFPNEKFAYRIGIITPYKEQVSVLKSRFGRYFGPKITDVIDFNTVDGFQGQEKDIIIFSCVRSSSGEGGNTIGFLSDVRRMNVGLTRARQSLFVIGDADTLRPHQFWMALLEDAKKRNVWHVCLRPYFGRVLIPQDSPKNVFEVEGNVVQNSHGRNNELSAPPEVTKSSSFTTRKLALAPFSWQT